MEKQYWKQFESSGSVEDYLYYKGVAICSRIMEKYEAEDVIQTGGDNVESISNGDRYCYVGNTNWRIR